MQRKQILKGKLYTGGYQHGVLVRVRDTSASPVQAERWNFFTQAWEPFTIQPRDLDPYRQPTKAADFVKVSDTINAALRRRYLHAAVDAVNAYVGEGVVTINTSQRMYSLTHTPEGEDRAEVEIPVEVYTRMVEGSSPPPVGKIVMPASSFFTWVISTQKIDVPTVADIVLPPGAEDYSDELDTSRIREVEEAAAFLNERSERAREIAWQAEFTTEVKRAYVEKYPQAAGERYMSRHTVERQDKALHDEVLTRFLAAEGLLPEDASRFSARELAPQVVLDTAARLRSLQPA